MPTPGTLPPRDYMRAGFYLALGVVLLVLLALVVRRFAEATLAVLAPFAVGLIFALLLDPLADKLTKRGLGRTPAVGLVFAAFLLVFVGIGWLTIPALIAQATDLSQNGPTYITGLQERAQH